MVKDRLAELQNIQCQSSNFVRTIDGYQNQYTERSALLLEHNGNWSSMEDYLTQVTAIREDLNSLDVWLNEVRLLHNELLSTPGADAGLTEKLNTVVNNFSRKSMAIRDKVKELDSEVKTKEKFSSPTEIHSVDTRIRKNQVMTLIKALHDVMSKFNDEQEIYKEQCTKNITNYLKIHGMSLSEDEISDVVDSGDINELTKGIVLAYSDRKALFEDVKSRRDQLFNLEKLMRQLHEMFADLNILVVSQGEMLDRIESNIEDAVTYAEKAKENVRDARNLQKSARRKKVIICVIMAGFVLILLFMMQAVVCHFTPIC
uniref:t-SNARE coiled-coil homology domain-containing protein n=1 Tax=Heterorhabditis bacteriophora TaxID=37862 RepID=A0A1I7XVA9_HETBA